MRFLPVRVFSVVLKISFFFSTLIFITKLQKLQRGTKLYQNSFGHPLAALLTIHLMSPISVFEFLQNINVFERERF